MRHESISSGEPEGREFAQRASVSLLCEVRQGLEPWRLVRLEDISQAGFRIAWLPDANLQKPVRIRIPGLRLLSATIRWQRGKSVGCEFDETLHVAVFENILRQANQK